MTTPSNADINEYQGTVLMLIERTVTDLKVKNFVTSLYGDKDRPCSQQVKDKLVSLSFSDGSELMSVQNYAFFECSKLSSVDLSLCEKLRNIDAFAFSGCPLLTTVTFPETNLTTIGISAFQSSGVKSITIPTCISTIESKAFQDCKQLSTFIFKPGSKLTCLTKYFIYDTKIASFCIPKSVIKIVASSFEGTSQLTDLTVEEGNANFYAHEKGIITVGGEIFVCFPAGITGKYTVPNGIKNILDCAFITCQLSEVVFPETLETIGSYAFTNAANLLEINIPDSVTSLGNGAFIGVKSATKVKLSKNCTTIGSYAFNKCRFASIEIPEGVEVLGSFCFSDNPNLVQIVLPSTIDKIEGGVFPRNKDLKIEFAPGSNLKITDDFIITDKDETYIVQYIGSDENFHPTISNTITTIKEGAFSSKLNLIGITFSQESQLTQINDFAFKSCINLRAIEFPATVVGIGKEAFYECNGLESIVLGSVCSKLGDYCFAMSKKLRTVDLRNTQIFLLASELFLNCIALEEVYLPTGNLSFSDKCFTGCTKLSTISIPSESVISNIGEYSFQNTKISSFTFNPKSSLTEIKRHAFSGCQQLSAIEMCDSITKLGFGAFAFTAFSSINLSPNISEINGMCFSSCPNLVSFNIPADSALTVDGFGIGLFSNCTSFSKITCESANFDASIGGLFTADGKQLLIFPPASLTTCLPIPESVETIRSGAFFNCKRLNSIIISRNSVKTIGNSAFEGCSNLHYINIPERVEIVGDKAFSGCTSLICGVDVESKDPTFINNLFTIGMLPRKAIKRCNELTCNVKHAYSLPTRLLTLFVVFGLNC